MSITGSDQEPVDLLDAFFGCVRSVQTAADVVCPLSQVPTVLEGKDWTRYEGVLHTDHAVREEFFLDREVAPTASKPYLMDFTYLYDKKQEDFREFTGGKPFSVEEVFAETGRPEDWTHRGKTRPRASLYTFKSLL